MSSGPTSLTHWLGFISPLFSLSTPLWCKRELCDPADFYLKNPVCTIVSPAHNFSLSLTLSPQECPSIHPPNFYHCALPFSKLTHRTILRGDWAYCRNWIESCTLNHWSPIALQFTKCQTQSKPFEFFEYPPLPYLSNENSAYLASC